MLSCNIIRLLIAVSLALSTFSCSTQSTNSEGKEFSGATKGDHQVDESFSWVHGGIERGDATQKIIHLAFTGDEYNDGGLHIKQVLERHDLKAHFFFTGNFYRIEAHHSTIKGLVEDGHYVGAHSDKHLLYCTWENRDSLLVTKKEFTKDLLDNYSEMVKFGIERKDAPLFMPPYEWYNDSISSWTKELGFQLINFTPGTGSNADYTTPDMESKYWSSEKIYNRILTYEQTTASGLNGFILLIHIGTHPDRTDKFYNHLEEVIVELKNRAYSFSLLKF